MKNDFMNFALSFVLVTSPVVLVNGEPDVYAHRQQTVKKTPNKVYTQNTYTPTISTSVISTPKKYENDSIQGYVPNSKEWFAFQGNEWKYDYKVTYSDRTVIALTNILYKESRGFETKNHLVDKYLVVLCAVRKAELKFDSNMDKFIKALQTDECNMFGWRDYFYTPKSGDSWDNCLEVVKNVLENNIPDFVPYAPHGTINYWNSRIDTNHDQRRMLQNKYVIFASTVKGHHFFVREKELSEEERLHLKNVSCENNIPKNISNGVYCEG